MNTVLFIEFTYRLTRETAVIIVEIESLISIATPSATKWRSPSLPTLNSFIIDIIGCIERAPNEAMSLLLGSFSSLFGISGQITARHIGGP